MAAPTTNSTRKSAAFLIFRPFDAALIGGQRVFRYRGRFIKTHQYLINFFFETDNNYNNCDNNKNSV